MYFSLDNSRHILNFIVPQILMIHIFKMYSLKLEIAILYKDVF